LNGLQGRHSKGVILGREVGVTDYRDRADAGLFDPDPEVREKAIAKWNKEEAKAKKEAEEAAAEEAEPAEAESTKAKSKA
jgi:hypothetical protein